MEKVVKETKGKGCVCRDEQGEEIYTYEETLDCVVEVNLEPLQDFLNMVFEDNEAQKMASVAKALLERAKEKIDVASEYITEHYGTVQMIRASYIQHSVKPETILGLTFIPAKEV